MISTTVCLRFASPCFFFSSYLYLPKSRILQTGGSALGLTSTRSRPLLLRHAERFLRLQHAEHAAVGADDAHFGDADAVVDSDLGPRCCCRRIECPSDRVANARGMLSSVLVFSRGLLARASFGHPRPVRRPSQRAAWPRASSGSVNYGHGRSAMPQSAPRSPASRARALACRSRLPCRRRPRCRGSATRRALRIFAPSLSPQSSTSTRRPRALQVCWRPRCA